jgi:hypothetical protein
MPAFNVVRGNCVCGTPCAKTQTENAKLTIIANVQVTGLEMIECAANNA